MKKEIKALLEAENGVMDINSLFKLVRYTVKPEDDYLGRSIDGLRLEMQNRYKSSVDIKSRDTSGIMTEVLENMDKMIDEYKVDLLRRFSGGSIGKYY